MAAQEPTFPQVSYGPDSPCPACGGRMKIIAAITGPASIRQVLDALGLHFDGPFPMDHKWDS